MAAHELDLKVTKVANHKKQSIAVVGAGPAGLSFATTAAMRGHKVTLFEKDKEVGGQFNMAKLIPGKEEFYETIRYFEKQLELSQVTVKLGHDASLNDLMGFDSIVIATGVAPRKVLLSVLLLSVLLSSVFQALLLLLLLLTCPYYIIRLFFLFVKMRKVRLQFIVKPV